MSKFSNRAAVVLCLALLPACQSVIDSIPKPGEPPPPQPTVEATAPTPEAAPPPADRNQLAYEEAITALKSDNVYHANAILEKISREAPDKPFIFTNLGLTYLKLEKTELAEQAFRQAIARDDRDAVAYNHLGILLRQKGEFDEARKSYQRAIEIDSNYARAHLNLGILFDIYLQDLNKALKQYQAYQALVSEEDAQVAGWILDIERRL